jgi:hypothetical protein
MLHITNGEFLAGAIALLIMVFAVRAILRNRRQNADSFSDFSGPDYNRDLLRQSSWSETEDWLADRYSSFAPLRRRDRSLAEQKRKVSAQTRRNRE